MLKFFQSTADCLSVCLDQALIASDQALDADLFGRVERRIPAGATVVVAARLVNQHFCGLGVQATQNSAELFAGNLAKQAKLLGTTTGPHSYHALLLGVVVVLGVFLFVIGLGLGGGQGAFRHDEHQS
jgi:hypothetical protein